MTTQVQQPYTRLVGNSALKRYTYTFTIKDSEDLLVFVDSVLMVQYSAYTIENVTDAGGDVVLADFPAEGAVIYLIRRTSIDQQVDYTEAPFEVESHEGVLDRIVRILQEITGGAYVALDSDGNQILITFDLDVETGLTSVTITNSGGTDALIPPWESGTKAGVFAAEITTDPPADGAATTHQNGHIWIEVAP